MSISHASTTITANNFYRNMWGWKWRCKTKTSTETGQENISAPPPRGNNLFSNKDDPIIVSRLAPKVEREDMQVDCNTITTALVRCNTSMQVCMASTQSKTASFYTANYMSKQPCRMQNIIPLIYQAEEEFREYGTTAKDATSCSRKAKNLFKKIISKSSTTLKVINAMFTGTKPILQTTS